MSEHPHRPTPRPKPRPGPPPVAAGQPTPDVATSPPSDPTRWGRVDQDGTVYVSVDAQERSVGSYPDATAEQALAYFGRKFDELVALVDLAEQRLHLPDPPIKDIVKALDQISGGIPEAAVVGDLEGLGRRIERIHEMLRARRAEADAARAAARAEAAQIRTALVTQAEELAGTPVHKMQWRPAGEQMKALFEQWKSAQSAGPRLDKVVEDDLWKRFSHARNAFDRSRRTHFTHLHSEQDEAKARKEQLVAEAEALASSTDWGASSAQFRDLMTQWKGAGRASRKDDDALWARFRGAQDAFFAARNARQAEQDSQFTANLAQKEELLAAAEALLPVRDPAAAKTALRAIHERWDTIGMVPRSAMTAVERRMRTVEQAVRGAENETWKKGNPETRARASSALDQLDHAIAELEREVAATTAAGDTKQIAAASQALATKRAWRDQIAKSFG